MLEFIFALRQNTRFPAQAWDATRHNWNPPGLNRRGLSPIRAGRKAWPKPSLASVTKHLTELVLCPR